MVTPVYLHNKLLTRYNIIGGFLRKFVLSFGSLSSRSPCHTGTVLKGTLDEKKDLTFKKLFITKTT